MRTMMAVLLCLVLGGFGCVQRRLTITTRPQGALVWLNDKEVGRTPVTIPFEWYGDYDVVIRKPPFETIVDHRKLKTPWYQYPPIDFFAECLIPATVYDEHAWHFDLAPAEPVVEADLYERAVDARTEATGDRQEAANDGDQ